MLYVDTRTSKTKYNEYYKLGIDLARSLVIKIEGMAYVINEELNKQGVLISDDKTTWTYYKHLAGQYTEKDTVMSCVSLDFNTEIELYTEILAKHPITKKDLINNAEIYKNLVIAFPMQETLLRGIITPVDINTAINAEDHSILYYDKDLVESNETNLIPYLEERIKGFLARWNNPAYVEIDNLYLSGYLAVLYLSIPKWIMAIRQANCRTEYAHSFHIQEYLRSHQYLDRYCYVLNKKQQLFLYRNILYLENNAGKQSNFDWLVDAILTEREIGLAEFNIKYKNTTILDKGNLRPELVMSRKPLNRFHQSYLIEDHSLEDYVLKTEPLAKDNVKVQEELLDYERKRLPATYETFYKTKTLESSIIDWTLSGAILRNDMLLYYWVYWTMTGRYVANIRIKHPKNNNELVWTPFQALIVFLFVSFKTLSDVDWLNQPIPPFFVQLIRKPINPTKEELRKVVPVSEITEKLFDDTYDKLIEKPLKDDPIYTSSEFIDLVLERIQDYYKHRELFSLEEYPDVRGYLQGMITYFYKDELIPLFEETITFKEWLDEQLIEVDDLTVYECESFSVVLFETVTGVNLNKYVKPTEVQKILVDLMVQLSSYTIQFVREVNPGPIILWDWPAVRTPIEVRNTNGVVFKMTLPYLLERVTHKGSCGVKISTQVDMLIQSFKPYTIIKEESFPRLSVKDMDKDFIQLRLNHVNLDIPSLSQHGGKHGSFK